VEGSGEPDAVYPALWDALDRASAGGVPTLETRAAISLLKRDLPELRIRMVNVVDLFTLISLRQHPHGLDEAPFDMTVQDQMSRFHLAMEAIQRFDRVRSIGGEVVTRYLNLLSDHRAYINRDGEDMPEIANWRWSRGG